MFPEKISKPKQAANDDKSYLDKITKLTGELNQVSANLERAKESLADVRETQSLTQREISRLENIKRELETSIEDLKAERTRAQLANESDVQSAKECMDKLADNIKDLNRQAGELQKDIDSKQGTLKELDKKREDLESIIVQLSSVVEKLQKKVEALEARLTELLEREQKIIVKEKEQAGQRKALESYAKILQGYEKKINLNLKYVKRKLPAGIPGSKLEEAVAFVESLPAL